MSVDTAKHYANDGRITAEAGADPATRQRVTLIALSGLPGVGKTTLARELARRVRAVHLRVDSVEAALKRSTLHIHPAEDAGYVVLAALAVDNLGLGLDVVVDTVNPLTITRELWRDAAERAGASLLNVWLRCEDQRVHRERVEARRSDIEGLTVPDWKRVTDREFEPWNEPLLTLDTGRHSVEECATRVLAALEQTDLPIGAVETE